MSGAQVIVAVAAGIIGTGGLGAALVQWLKNRSDQRLARAPDWATFAAELRAALTDERVDAQRDAEARNQRIDALQDALATRDTAVRARDQYIDALKHQIWLNEGPPPVEPPLPY